MIDVNLSGIFYACQAFARVARAMKRPAAIINVSSTSSIFARPSRAAYVSSKHGVSGLTKQLALDFGQLGIRVNAVAPGVVRTPMTQSYFEAPQGAEHIAWLDIRWGELQSPGRHRVRDPVFGFGRRQLHHGSDVAGGWRLFRWHLVVAGESRAFAARRLADQSIQETGNLDNLAALQIDDDHVQLDTRYRRPSVRLKSMVTGEGFRRNGGDARPHPQWGADLTRAQQSDPRLTPSDRFRFPSRSPRGVRAG